MANQTGSVATHPPSQPADRGAPSARQTTKPDPKLPGIRVLKEGSDRSTQSVHTLTEIEHKK